jgi:CDP-glucose 4,6-dehydratase
MEVMGSINNEFWRDRSVFLTGHTGFKGSWLSTWLIHLGARVNGYALKPNTSPNLFDEAFVRTGLENHYEADIRDLSQLTASVNATKPEIVIHMAAQPLVRESYKNPYSTYSTNVMGTVNVLEAVRNEPSVRAVIIVTTDKCYENREWIWGYREDDLLGGFDPYSNSKACAELVTSCYRKSFFDPADFDSHKVVVASARAGNVIGGGDWSKDRLLPDVIRSLEVGSPVQIRNPSSLRPWQHVLEPLFGYMTLAKKMIIEGPMFGEAFNFGPLSDGQNSVGDVVSQICALWGNGASWYCDDQKHPHEANLLSLDVSKSVSKLGWTPRFKLEQALKMTLEWSKFYSNGVKAKSLMLDQIKQYEELGYETNERRF